MKELYIAPELNVLCFAPVERLAVDGEINFDILQDVSGEGPAESAGRENGDLDLDL